MSAHATIKQKQIETGGIVTSNSDLGIGGGGFCIKFSWRSGAKNSILLA